MKIYSKRIYAAVLSMMIVSLISLSCGKGKPENAVISFYSGTASIRSGSAESRPVKLLDIVNDGDIIETGDKSWVVLQVGDELLVRFEANTKAVVTVIADIAKREINLEKGKILSKVSKLQKGSEYSVKTPTAVASVRGTEFLTDFYDGTTAVAVGTGKVQVVARGSKEEKLVDSGKSAVVAEKLETRDLNQIETLELKKLVTTPVVKVTGSMNPGKLEEAFKGSAASDEAINIEIDKLQGTGMTLDEIRAKYNRIDVIYLYNRPVIRGAILYRGGEFWKIITPSGVVTIKSKSVQKTGSM